MMTDKFIDIDLAMNLIKEDVIKELYEAVSNSNKDSYYQDINTNNISFSDSNED